MELWGIYRWLRWCIFLRNKGAEEQQSLGRNVKKCTPSLEKVRIKISPFGSLHHVQVDVFLQSVKVWNFCFVKCWSFLRDVSWSLNHYRQVPHFYVGTNECACFRWGRGWTFPSRWHQHQHQQQHQALRGFTLLLVARVRSLHRASSRRLRREVPTSPLHEWHLVQVSVGHKGSAGFVGPVGWNWGPVFLLGVFWGRRVEGNDETAWKHHIATSEWTEGVLFVAV